MIAQIESLRTARARGERPSAPNAKLRGADLRNANLQGADLWNASLWCADLRGADLRNVNLRNADLRNVNLRNADLRGANLRGANLWNADLRGANLRGANLLGANLWNVNLRGSYLRNAGIVALGETPSGGALIFPTCEGWVMQVGCWRGSPDDLRAMIAGDEGWPEADTPEERARRRPYLEAVLTHVDLITAEMAHLIYILREKWSTPNA